MDLPQDNKKQRPHNISWPTSSAAVGSGVFLSDNSLPAWQIIAR